MPRTFVTQQQVAAFLGVHVRTVRNLISRGQLTGYRVPGLRAVRLDFNEVQALVKAIPTVSRREKTPFGPNARIVNVVPRAEVVPAVTSPAES